MKNILFIGFISILFIPFSGFSQIITLKTIELQQITIHEKLDAVKAQLSENIYERQINLGYVSSPDEFDRNFAFPSHNKLNFLFYRFKFFEENLVDVFENGYTGMVFISERYLEDDYLLKNYQNCESFKNDKDGFFYFFKLYYNEENRDFRINIYPEYVYNICSKKMHWNTKDCKNLDEHKQTVNSLIKLNDKYYKNFFEQNDTTAINQFIKSIIDKNIHVDDKYITSMEKRDFIRTVNFRKQIKCFTVSTLDDADPESICRELRLVFTKYSYSDDLLENTSYTLKKFDCASVFNEIARAKTELNVRNLSVTRNILYRSLAISPEPDDFFADYAVSQLEGYNLIYLNQNQFSKQKDLPKYDEIKIDGSEKDGRQYWLFYKKLPVGASPEQSQQNFICREFKASLEKVKKPVLLRDTIPVFKSSTREWKKGAIVGFLNELDNAKKDENELLKGFKDCVGIHIIDDQYVWIQINIVNNKARKDGGKNYRQKSM